MISGQVLATFEIDSLTGQIVLKMTGYGDLELGSRDGLAAARNNLDHYLSSFKDKLDHPQRSLDSLADAVKDLDSSMAQIAYILTKDNDGLLKEVTRRFVAAWPQWQRATRVVPVVEVVGHDDEFPFELLPIFDGRSIDGFDNLADAEDALRRFLGFGAVVRRTTGEPVATENLIASPHLPVQFLRYTTPRTADQAAYIRESLPQIDMEGPWPGPGLSPEDAEERLIGALYDPTKNLAGRTRPGPPPTQIQHFACHCRTANATDDGYTLVLGGPDKEDERKVTLAAIREGFRKRDKLPDEIANSRPLIILNACCSAAVDKESRRSFQNWFLGNNYRAFVGTESEVPDDVAADFAERLYEEMLGGRPLGEAIVLARRRLLAERSSPLGLLYVLYGNPALSVTGSAPPPGTTSLAATGRQPAP